MPSSEVAEVLFFPDPNMPCKSYVKKGSCKRGDSCQYAHSETSLCRFLRYINGTKRNLEICVFSITCDEIAQGISDAFNRGVTVRIITDDDQALSQGSDIARLAQLGIPVHTDNSTYHMHNKFAIIDDLLVLNGSFNWTRSAVLNNKENISCFTHPKMAAAYNVEFEKLWKSTVEFKP